ncbi:MAG: HD domain-containing phosphohydrolase [Desulfurobacteriaceae bacterium]
MDLAVDISKFLLAVSSLNSLADSVLNNHNYRVAFISYSIAREISYSSEFLSNLLVAGLLHDIGLLLIPSTEDIVLLKASDFHENEKRIHLHAEVGYELFRRFPYFSKIAKIIRYHHYPYKFFFKSRIPYSAFIIHLADRIDTFVLSRINTGYPYSYLSSFIPELESYLKKFKGRIFEPRLVDIFLKKICPKEAFWYELLKEDIVKETLEELLKSIASKLPLEAFFDLAQIFAYLIDFKSPFTATHSSGVAQTAVSLAALFNFTSPDLKKMKVAGLLHDVGKIAIPNEILEKPAKLTVEEYDVMKSHVFFSYKLISKLGIDRNIVEWAAYHHETLDGKGYPFKLRAKDLSLGSRIMAVADIFTALMEDRPYKKGLPVKRAIAIIDDLVKNGKLDKKVVNVLKENLEKINVRRETAQKRAVEVYSSLRELVQKFTSS